MSILNTIAQAYAEAGTFALIATLSASVVVTIIRRSSLSSQVLWALCAVPLVCGLIGYAFGLYRVDQALTLVDPVMADAIRTQGHSEAQKNIYIGAFWSVACAITCWTQRR